MVDETHSELGLKSGCPPAHVWNRYRDGYLDAESIEALSEHLSSCEKCLMHLEAQQDFETHVDSSMRDALLKRPAFVDESNLANLEVMIEGLEIQHNPERTQSIQKSIEDHPRAPGRFEVKSVLGEGGFADVFLAHDSLLQRDVAIKAPRSSAFNSETSLAFFLNEARHAASLKGDGLVDVYDVLPDEAGSTLIVMQYVDGKSLKKHIESGPMCVEDAVDVMIQVAEAVQCAHERGFIHCDLKPANILLGKDRRAYVADFGLGFNLFSQKESNMNTMGGTLPYMSPEQVQRQITLIDHRSDIWSLGVILVELIHGHRPFPLKVRTELQASICDSEPCISSSSATHQIDAIARKCLEKRPDERFQSAKALAEELKAWRLTYGSHRLARWLSGWRQLLLTATILAVTAIVGCVFYFETRASELRSTFTQMLAADVTEIPDLLARIKSLQSPFMDASDLARPTDERGQSLHGLVQQYCGLMNIDESCDLAEKLSDDLLAILMKHGEIDAPRIISELVRRSKSLPKRQRFENAESIPVDRVVIDKTKARLATILWVLGQRDFALDDLVHDPDPTLQTLLIQSLSQQPVSTSSVLDDITPLLKKTDPQSVGQKFALLQILALLPPRAEVQRCESLLKELYLNDPDGGVHSSAVLAAQKHGITLPAPSAETHGSWFYDDICGTRQCFVMIEPCVVQIGSKDIRRPFEPFPQHQRRFPRRIAMSTTEITIEQFRQFNPNYNFSHLHLLGASPKAAMMTLTQQSAYEFCNHLSAEKGLEPCYEANPDVSEGLFLIPKRNHLELSGFRLPTDAEWELACRAGTVTERSFGMADDLVSKYGWLFENVEQHDQGTKQSKVSQVVAKWLPNRWGLFDMYGNAKEICIESTDVNMSNDTTLDDAVETAPYPFVVRGASFYESGVAYAHSFWRIKSHSTTAAMIKSDPTIGVRVVRSVIK